MKNSDNRSVPTANTVKGGVGVSNTIRKRERRLHFRGTPPACGCIGYLLVQRYIFIMSLAIIICSLTFHFPYRSINLLTPIAVKVFPLLVKYPLCLRYSAFSLSVPSMNLIAS